MSNKVNSEKGTEPKPQGGSQLWRWVLYLVILVVVLVVGVMVVLAITAPPLESVFTPVVRKGIS